MSPVFPVLKAFPKLLANERQFVNCICQHGPSVCSPIKVRQSTRVRAGGTREHSPGARTCHADFSWRGSRGNDASAGRGAWKAARVA